MYTKCSFMYKYIANACAYTLFFFNLRNCNDLKLLRINK